jgi:hypothetical protein
MKLQVEIANCQHGYDQENTHPDHQNIGFTGRRDEAR